MKMRIQKRLIALVMGIIVVFGNNVFVINAKAETGAGQNLVVNGDFENGVVDWTVVKGGTASNNGHDGKHYYLDANGIIYQAIKAPYTGYYKMSTWLSVGGAGGKFGARIKASGEVIKEVDVASLSAYNQYEIEIPLQEGDIIEIYVKGNSNWTNGDSFSVTYNTARFVNLIVNDQFTSDAKWTVEDAAVGNGTAILNSAASKIEQTVGIPIAGNYYLDVEFINAENAAMKCGDQVKTAISGSKTVRIESDLFEVDDKIKVEISGKATVKSVTLKFDLSKIPNEAPTVSNINIKGTPMVGELLVAEYDFADEDGHEEGNSVYKWFLADVADGEFKQIEGATTKQLSILPTYKDKYIKFQVIPVDQYEGIGQEYRSDAVGPIDLNIVDNPGFEEDGKGWSGISISNKNAYKGLVRGIINKNAIAYQTITVPQTGYYDFSAYIRYAGTGTGKAGVRDVLGQVIAEIEITNAPTYVPIQKESIPLEKGQKIQVFFQGATDESYDVDEILLKIDREKGAPVYLNIYGLTTSSDPLNTIIDTVGKNIEIEYLFGTDLTQIKLAEILVSEGATASVGAGTIMNLSSPYQITITGSDGSEQIWTISAKEAEKKVTLFSSNKYLQDTFNWAANKQRQFVMTGKEGVINKYEGQTGGDGTGNHAYIPSYWAGYYDRTAFYSRDFLHQATGGQIAGLTLENYSMFEAFAKQCTEARKWYTVWAMNFDGSPITIDYKNDNNFVREVPAQFEMVEKAYKQYLWSGDERYINNDVLWNFYTKIMTDFITLHDTNGNGIAEGTGTGNIFEGSCTYNERGEHPIEAGDAIGSQYQATLAYAGMLAARGETAASEEWYQKAADLKDYFNNEWSVKEGEDQYVRALGPDGTKYTGFGKENSWFMPLKMITESGERNTTYIDFIIDKLGNGIGTAPEAPSNLEAYTYIPDMLFLYNRNDEAWKWMKYITSIKDLPHERAAQGTNGDYPEISFTFVSHTIEGMMGVEPDGVRGFIATAPRLPDEVPDVTAKYIDIGDYEIELTHEGNINSTLTNGSDKDLSWEVRFYGDHKYIKVGDQTYETESKDINGEKVSYITTTVPAGAKVNAFATEDSGIIEVETITLDKSQATLTVGEELTLNAEVGPVEATDKSITWTSSNPAVAVISNTGKITTLKAGTTIITAKAGDKTATCIVTVKDIKVTSVSLNSNSLSIVKGYKATLKETVLPANAANKKVVWSSSDNAIATVTQTGIITAKKAGKVVIKATAADGSGKYKTCVVNVYNKTKSITVRASGYSLNGKKLNIQKGKSVTLKASVATKGAMNGVTYKTSNKSIATVSTKGVIKTKKVGKVKITITSKDKKYHRTYMIQVTKKAETATKIKSKVKSIKLRKNGTKYYLPAKLSITKKGKYITSKYTYKSLNKKVAKIDKYGDITAVKKGKTTIVIKNGKATLRLSVTVK